MSAQLKPYVDGDGEFDLVSILLQGADVWNLWRIRNKGLAINLSGGDLQGNRVKKCVTRPSITESMAPL